MTKYIIPIPIYNGTLHLVDCKDTKEALMEIKGDVEIECETSDGSEHLILNQDELKRVIEFLQSKLK